MQQKKTANKHKRKRDIEPRPTATSPTDRRGANGSAGPSPRLKSPKAPPRAAALGSLTPVLAPPLASVPAPPPGPRLPPAPLPPINAGGSAPVPLSAGDARLGMRRERRSERCAGIRIGGCCCCAGSEARRKHRDRDLGPGIRVPVPPVFPVGAGPSRFFLGGQGTGVGTRGAGARGSSGNGAGIGTGITAGGKSRSGPGAVALAAAGAGLGPAGAPDTLRLRRQGAGAVPLPCPPGERRFPGAAAGSRLEAGRTRRPPVAAPRSHRHRRSLSAAARPGPSCEDHRVKC
ncbi:uncharacterized protein LOC141729214 isoform X2 [Zonotrichia albicollis]|uniref:uncharacterized protein LOC141729214 isoform X2 n=1 Tax=Zonotrichia albicollis TaxID=44394 RepID=UPI003D80C93F